MSSLEVSSTQVPLAKPSPTTDYYTVECISCNFKLQILYLYIISFCMAKAQKQPQELHFQKLMQSYPFLSCTWAYYMCSQILMPFEEREVVPMSGFLVSCVLAI